MLSKTFGHLIQRYFWNEEVRNTIRHASGLFEDLNVTTLRKHKLRWYGHITRSTGFAKMIIQGTVQGGRRKGRQKMRWEDDILEWAGLKLGEALLKTINREEWRKSGSPIFLDASTVI